MSSCKTEGLCTGSKACASTAVGCEVAVKHLCCLVPREELGEGGRELFMTPYHCICRCSVAESCLTLHDPVNCSKPGSSVLHDLPELAQSHVYSISDAIQYLTLTYKYLKIKS